MEDHIENTEPTPSIEELLFGKPIKRLVFTLLPSAPPDLFWKGRYREEGEFEFEGTTYDLGLVFDLCWSLRKERVPVRALAWNLERERRWQRDPAKVIGAQMIHPLITTPASDGREAVLDGIFRLAKAKRCGVRDLPVFRIPPEELASCVIGPDGSRREPSPYPPGISIPSEEDMDTTRRHYTRKDVADLAKLFEAEHGSRPAKVHLPDAALRDYSGMVGRDLSEGDDFLGLKVVLGAETLSVG